MLPLDTHMKILMILLDLKGIDYKSDRITLALLFALTSNFGINVEYSHADLDIGSADTDADEIYIEEPIHFLTKV